MLGETVLLFVFLVALKWWLLFFVAWCPHYITVMHEPYVFSKCCRYHFLFSNFSLSSFMCLSNLSILSWIASILSSAACTLLNKLSTSDIVTLLCYLVRTLHRCTDYLSLCLYQSRSLPVVAE